MRRLVDFVLTVLATFYLAVIYNSKSLVFLGYAEIFIVLLLFLYNCLVFFRLKVVIDAPLGITEFNKKIPIRIVVYNYGKLPTGKIGIQLLESYALKPKKRKTVFYSSVAGKKRGQSYASAEIYALWRPQYIGKAIITLRRVRCFDLLGVLVLPLPKKAYQSSEKVTILPEIFPVSVETGARSREFAMEQDRYLLTGTEEYNTEQFQIREYQQGDRLRNIHWKLSAKEDELIVREYLPVIGCSVLFFLDLSGESEKKRGVFSKSIARRKEVQKKKKAFLSILLSVSSGIAQSGCKHFVIWYDEKKEDVMRYCVEKEEDVYGLLTEFDCLEETKSGFNVEEEYERKYHERAYVTKLVLNQRLQLFCDGELLMQYPAEGLGQALASYMIYL